MSDASVFVVLASSLRYRAPRYTSPNAACQSLKFPDSNIIRLVSRRKLNIARFRCTTCGLSQSPFRRFGTHCRIRCVIRPSSLNVVSAGLENASLCRRTLETLETLERCHRFTEWRYTLIDIYFTTTYLLTLACTVAN